MLTRERIKNFLSQIQTRTMKIRGKFFVRFLGILIILINLNGCIMLDIKGAGVFKDQKYDHRYLSHVSFDNAELTFKYLGDCGGSGFALGIMVPIPIPWYFKNTCQENGFSVGRAITSSSNVFYQLRYNGKIYDPYFETSEIRMYGKKLGNDMVKFKIPNFSAFKKATDKTLIIHKKRPDGSIFTKELPFDWKIVVEVSGGL